MTTADRSWYDDSDQHDAIQRAERATRFGWAAITGMAGGCGCALIAVAAVGVVAILTCLCLVVAMDY
ncbi:hypothetical protein [Streptomyces sp. NPDC059828]|uniref:hypothetical protein n=1 Tax=Streptomyces sp. NPDC059828 TaxID=3346965 RepID=UPI00365757C4